MSTYKEIGKAAQKYAEAGYTQAEIAKALTKDGLTSTTGKTLGQSHVSIAMRVAEGKYKPRKVAKVSKKKDVIGLMTDILTSNLSEDAKETIIRSVAKQL